MAGKHFEELEVGQTFRHDAEASGAVSGPGARRRRSVHFVPGGNERMMTRTLTLPADGLILDLEDAVPPDRKEATRPIVRQWLATLDFGGRERWVRMNPLATGFGVRALEETIAGRPDGYVVPKPRSAADLREVAQHLDRTSCR